MKNLTDFRKTVETGVDPRLQGKITPCLAIVVHVAARGTNL